MQSRRPHGLSFSQEQLIGQAQLRVVRAEEALQSARETLAALNTCGVEGVRDTDSPCEYFKTDATSSIPVIPVCNGDGHYMCDECLNHNPVSKESATP
jgi:hypothetical protein